MTKLKCCFKIVFLAVFLNGCCSSQIRKDAVFQISAIRPLLEGSYEGSFSYTCLRQYGDFGIGTFDNLDGEMIGFDNEFYQIKADGLVYRVNGLTKTGFAMVKFFRPDKKVFLKDEVDFAQLQLYIDKLLLSPNIIYAIKIEGKFPYIKTRSVPKQHKPYLPLAQVTKKQAVFEFKETRGLLIGFRFPPYFDGINVPGYHFHFISEDRKSGGHVLDCRLNNARVQIDDSFDFCVKLPESTDFLKMDLTKDNAAELRKAERDR